MQIRAEQKSSRQSPRKVRLVANQVKSMSLTDAFSRLALMERKSALLVMKVLRQAVANAVSNHQLTVDQLEIDNILVKTGPTYKRWQPVSRGRAHKILKRTSHVEVILKTKANAGSQDLATGNVAKVDLSKEKEVVKTPISSEKTVTKSKTTHTAVQSTGKTVFIQSKPTTRELSTKIKDQSKAMTVKKVRSTRTITAS